MLTFFQPGAKKSDVSQKCPICNVGQPASERYPNYVCRDCVETAKSKNGKPMRFFNESMSGGFVAINPETNRKHTSHNCYIKNIKCYADEAKFGGIVVQPIVVLPSKTVINNEKSIRGKKHNELKTALHDQLILDDLASIYEEVMWLAKRPNTSPTAARAWYTHVVGGRLTRRIKRFSGFVSKKALRNASSVLRLEHFKRIQATLTELIKDHLTAGENLDEFIHKILDCEQVHIVTFEENYSAMKAKGEYDRAKIQLVEWDKIPLKKQIILWNQMIKGKVANANDFRPKTS